MCIHNLFSTRIFFPEIMKFLALSSYTWQPLNNYSAGSCLELRIRLSVGSFWKWRIFNFLLHRVTSLSRIRFKSKFAYKNAMIPLQSSMTERSVIVLTQIGDLTIGTPIGSQPGIQRAGEGGPEMAGQPSLRWKGTGGFRPFVGPSITSK